ncbi:hypothetical protein B0H13DRAFT_2041724, partial [Mycena leptocephala]
MYLCICQSRRGTAASLGRGADPYQAVDHERTRKASIYFAFIFSICPAILRWSSPTQRSLRAAARRIWEGRERAILYASTHSPRPPSFTHRLLPPHRCDAPCSACPRRMPRCMRSVPPGPILRALLRGHLHGHRPQAAQESHLVSSRSDGYENGNETKRKIIKRKPSKMKTKIKKDVEEKVCQRITSGRIRTRTAYSPATYPPTPQRR